jgi:hypothetical protein
MTGSRESTCVKAPTVDLDAEPREKHVSQKESLAFRACQHGFGSDHPFPIREYSTVLYYKHGVSSKCERAGNSEYQK